MFPPECRVLAAKPSRLPVFASCAKVLVLPELSVPKPAAPGAEGGFPELPTASPQEISRNEPKPSKFRRGIQRDSKI